MVLTNPLQPSNNKEKGRATLAALTRGRGGRQHPRGPHTVISTGAQMSNFFHTPVQNESTSTTSDFIKWKKYPHLTNSLILWLLEHPAHQTILFYNKAMFEALTGSRGSENNKKAVNGKITQHLFARDAVYKDLYTAHISTKKFLNSMQSCLNTYESCLSHLLY